MVDVTVINSFASLVLAILDLTGQLQPQQVGFAIKIEISAIGDDNLEVRYFDVRYCYGYFDELVILAGMKFGG